jgi:WhiB family redox-sensing transcriptional regulator
MSLNDLYDDAPWMQDSACTLEDAEVFFPEQSPWMLSEIAAAKMICRGCPVRETCLTYALENDIEYGVWGGLTRNERLDIRRAHRRSLAAGTPV